MDEWIGLAEQKKLKPKLRERAGEGEGKGWGKWGGEGVTGSKPSYGQRPGWLRVADPGVWSDLEPVEAGGSGPLPHHSHSGN